VKNMNATPKQKQIRANHPDGCAWCEHCGRNVRFIRLDRLNELLDDCVEEDNDSPVTVQSVHFAKDSEGGYSICLQSLFGDL
jgi:hypothetical protein